MSDVPPPRALPTTLGAATRGPDGVHRGEFQMTSIVAPTEKDVATYGEHFNVCGDCRHGDFGELAQDKIHGERFYERLVQDEGWQVKHLCSAPSDLGLCGLSNGEMMTGRLHKGCDQFKPRNGLVRLTRKGG